MYTAVKPDLKSKNFCISKVYILQREKQIHVNKKFYQKLFVVLISLSTFLIFTESPRELENICIGHNTKTLCNVW